MAASGRPWPVVTATGIAVTVARADGGTAVVTVILVEAISGTRRLRAAALKGCYCTTVAATMTMSAANSAKAHSGTTMPHRRRAVKNEMTMASRATTGAP